LKRPSKQSSSKSKETKIQKNVGRYCTRQANKKIIRNAKRNQKTVLQKCKKQDNKPPRTKTQKRCHKTRW